MKQVLFSKTAEDTDVRPYRYIVLAKSLSTRTAFYTLMLRVFQGLLAIVVELNKKFYVSFKSFYNSASASASSYFVLNFTLISSRGSCSYKIVLIQKKSVIFIARFGIHGVVNNYTLERWPAKAQGSAN